MAITYYGADTSCTTDLPLISVTVTDPVQLIGQRLVRRLSVSPGAMATINGNPAGGFNLTQLVNAKLSPSDIASAQNRISAECLKDEEVQTATVTVTFAAGELAVSIQVVSSAGQFSLVLSINDLTTQVFLNG